MYQPEESEERSRNLSDSGAPGGSSSAGCSLRAAGALAVRFVLWHLLVAAPCLALLGTRVLAQTAGVTVSESQVTLDESTLLGHDDYSTYTLELDTAPTGNVTITVTSGDTAIATVSPTTLTFTTSNWETEQTVTVTGWTTMCRT